MEATITNGDPGKGAPSSNHDQDPDRSTVRNPDNLTIAVYPNHQSTTPAVRSVSWPALATTLLTHDRTDCTLATCPGKSCPGKYGQAWSPVVIDGDRADTNVRELTAVVLDLDHVTDLSCVDRLQADGLASVLHSTHSYREHDQCYRLAIPISRSLTPTEYRRAREAVIAHYQIPADPACKDLSRIYFGPTAPSDAPVVARGLPGAPLDVERFLAMAPVVEVAKVANTNATGKIKDGEGRHRHLVSYCGLQRDRGFDVEEILALALVENDRRFDPPKDRADVEQIAYSMGKYTPSVHANAGDLTAALTASMAPTMSPFSEANDTYGVNAAEWLGMEFGEDPWLIPGLIPEGVPMLLAGLPKAGKSWIELYLALCIATGRPAFGRTPVRSRVLVISREDRDRECQRRIALLMRGMGIQRSDLDGWMLIDATKPLYLDQPSDVARLRRTMDRFRPKFVAIDSLSRIHMRDENSRSEMAVVTNTWSDLCGEYGASVLMLHHVVKMGEGRSLVQRIRGSGDIVAMARMMIGVEKRADGTFEIETDGNMGDMAYPFQVRRTDLDSMGAPIKVEGAARHSIVMEVVSGGVMPGDSAGDPLATPLIGELVDQLNQARHTNIRNPGVVPQSVLRKGRGGRVIVDAALDLMVEHGIAELAYQGRKVIGYRLTAAGIQYAGSERRQDDRMPTVADLMRVGRTPLH